MPRPNTSDEKTEPSVPEPAPRRRHGCLWAFLGTALLLVLLSGFVFWRVENSSLRLLFAGGSHLERMVRDAFLAVAHVQPRVTVNERVVFEQTSPVMELAVVEREMNVERETTTSWLGSTKRIRLRAVYRVKAGFDLRQPFSVQVEGTVRRKVKAQLPAARILSSEQVRLEAMDLENGLWNRVKPQELQAEINTLNVEARLKALHAGLPREAETMLAEQLRQKLGPDFQLEISTATGINLPAESQPLP